MTNDSSAAGPVITSPIVQGGAAPPVVDSPTVEGVGGSATTPIIEPTSTGAAPEPVITPAAPDPAALDTNKNVPEVIQKRINEITAQKYAAERALKAAEDKATAAERANAELLAKFAGGTLPAAPAAAPAPAAVPAPSTMSQEDFDKLVEERAVQKAEIKHFNDSCDTVAANGRKTFPDWDDAVKNLTMVGALGNNVPLDFLNTAIELKNPEKVLHHLSKNLEEAGKLVKMPATKMAVEMARIEALVNAAPPPPPPVPVSQAPAPVIPVGGAAKPGSLSIDDPNTSMADFMRLRAEAEMEKRKRYTRV